MVGFAKLCQRNVYRTHHYLQLYRYDSYLYQFTGAVWLFGLVLDLLSLVLYLYM